MSKLLILPEIACFCTCFNAQKGRLKARLAIEKIRKNIMLIEENENKNADAVSAYRDGAIEIGGQIWREPLVLRGGTVSPMPAKRPSELQAADFFQTASDEELPEVIIVGTGAVQEFIHPKTIAEAAARGVGVECMNTASACRTLVLLQGEGRSVWAWLWP